MSAKTEHPLEESHLLSSSDSQGPKFYFFVTDQVYMRLLLSGLMGKANRAQYP